MSFARCASSGGLDLTSSAVDPCGRVVDLLVQYLEGELPADTTAELEHHLSRCSACVARLNTYRATVSLLASLRDDELPPELRNAVRAFLEPEGASGSARQRGPAAMRPVGPAPLVRGG